MPTPESFHHITLTVSSLDRSVEWYSSVLGIPKVADRVGEGWVRALLRGTDGFMIGLTQHEGTPEGETFDHQRIGLDHISISCADRPALESWSAHLDEVGAEHGPIVDAPAGSLLVCRDPDGIPVEFFASP